MKEFVRWLLGVDADPQWLAGDWHVEFHALPEGPLAVILIMLAIGAVAGIVALYRMEQRELRPTPRIVLACMRTLVLAVAVFMLLEMVVVLSKTETIPSRMLVLLDASESMALKDPYTDEPQAVAVAKAIGLTGKAGETPSPDALRSRSRLQVATHVLAPVLEELADGRDLTMYRFAGKLESLPPDGALTDVKADGPVTAIGDAMADALAAHRGQPLAGLLVVTDGRSNAGEDPLKVAEQAGSDGVPVYSLAVGTAEGPRNVRVAQLDVNPVVFVRDPATIAVLVDSRGMKDVPAMLTLEQRKGDGQWQELATREVTLGEDAALQRVDFDFTPDQVGDLEFRATIADVGPELTTGDNVSTARVQVIRQQIRVLLVAGAPSFEVQFLRNALLRDKQVEFASWLQSADENFDQFGDKPIRRLPVTQEELNHYDVLLLIDPNMNKMGPAWPEMIAQFVGEAGGGLIYVAGELFTPQLFNPMLADASTGGVVDNSWVKILPIVREPGLYKSSAELILSARETFALELTPQGSDDPVFRFDDDPSRNREILTSLPGMYWHFPVTRAKPGATVLVRHGDPRMQNSFGRHVLMATHLYGPGRTVFVGFDSTYRWRYLGEEYFDGFWARLIDRVGRSKVLGGRYPFTLTTDKTAFRVGDRVTVTARFLSATDLAANLGTLAADVEIGGEQAQSLTLEPVGEQPGVFQSSFLADEIGPYTVKVLPTAAAMQDPSSPRAATLSFDVEPPRQEIDNPTLDRALLEDIARTTGGEAFPVERADRIPEAVEVKRVARTLETREEVFDAPIVFTLLIVLLTTEWVVRKHFRLA